MCENQPATRAVPNIPDGGKIYPRPAEQTLTLEIAKQNIKALLYQIGQQPDTESVLMHASKVIEAAATYSVLRGTQDVLVKLLEHIAVTCNHIIVALEEHELIGELPESTWVPPAR